MFPTLILTAPFFLTVSYLDTDHHGLDDIFDYTPTDIESRGLTAPWLYTSLIPIVMGILTAPTSILIAMACLLPYPLPVYWTA